MNSRLKNILGITFVVLFLLSIIAVLAIWGGSLMRLLGFTYDSVGSVLLFFVLISVLSFPLEMLAKGFPLALLNLERISRKTARILFIILDTLSTCFIMSLADYFMDSVSATTSSIIVVSFIIALISLDRDKL